MAMYTFKFIKHISLSLLILFSLGACSAWLDVTPADSVTEDELLSTKEGFHQALNGIYLDMNSNSLYGATLLCRDIEVMAQRYAINTNNKNYSELSKFKYNTTTYAKDVFEGTWNSAYNLILSINKLIAQAETKKDMLGTEYNLIRGELFGLRAMLHFDMFRLFGPVLLVHPNDKAIPYKTSPLLETTPLLPAPEVGEKLLADLKEAETALAADPARISGPNNDPNSNDFWSSRALRMNYYAVKALEARVALYLAPLDAKYKTQAFNAATAVIKENNEKKWFPFVNISQIRGSKPDRIFSTEVLFMNENIRRSEQIHLAYFASSISPENILIPNSDMLGGLFPGSDYEVDDNPDIRYKPIWKPAAEISGLCFNKYASVNDGVSNDLVPLIRLSEMYLIAAETAPTVEEGFGYLNEFLPHRGLETILSDNDLSLCIQKEYRKEFFGEGQLFFFYKRMKASYMSVTGDEPWDGINISSPDVYVVPLPESETMYH